MPKQNGLSTQQKIERYYLPFSTQMETLLVSCLAFFFIALLFAQGMIALFKGQTAFFNKSVQYEGVFREEKIESILTLQRK